MNDRCEGIPEAVALSRADFPRQELTGLHDYSDEALVRTILGANVDIPRLGLLCGVSRLLRLMDGLLTSRETGEGFVEKFSREWLSLDDWDAEEQLSREFDWLNEFYSDIQLYSASPTGEQENALLFGSEHLLDLTRHAYARLKARWCDALLRDENRRKVDQ